MNTFAATLLLIGMAYGLPLWVALCIQLGVWLAMLIPHTHRDFLASMNLYRMARGGKVVLPADPDEHCNEPEVDFVVRWFLAVPGTLKNFVLAQLTAVLYFHVLPRPIRFQIWREGWKVRYKIRAGDVGLTTLINRLADEFPADSWQCVRSLAIRKRYLSRYDPRGLHV